MLLLGREMRRRASVGFEGWRLGVVCAGFVLASCSKQNGETPVLQAQDLSTDGNPPFDPNEIVDTASFTDYLTLDRASVQQFLEHNPYNGTSFLSTYQSNGVLAADAMIGAAETYHLNPLVFLVRAEMVQGLIAASSYPLPPSRVEYVFGCGCRVQGSCDPALAGFDRQVDCLAQALHESLEEIARNGTTSGGWGPGTTQTSIDGIPVTPMDEATAALYQYDPLVGVGSGGNWLFWNIWQKYALYLAYSGPMQPPAGTAAIGDACMSAADCADQGATCATNYPGGFCTLPCTGTCPNTLVQSFCGDFQTNGYCLPVCNPSSPSPCRPGYSCIRVHEYMNPDQNAAQNVCFSQ